MNTGRPVPAPPPHIAALMADAGRNGNDPVKLNHARALYAAWLDDNGYARDGGRR